MKNFEEIRERYEKETGQKIVGWVDDYSLWLEDFILKPKKTKFAPPTKEDVIEFFKLKGYTEQSAKQAFDYYNEADWKDSNGKQIRSWKQKMVGVWFREEHKSKAVSSGFSMQTVIKNK